MSVVSTTIGRSYNVKNILVSFKQTSFSQESGILVAALHSQSAAQLSCNGSSTNMLVLALKAYLRYRILIKQAVLPFFSRTAEDLLPAQQLSGGPAAAAEQLAALEEECWICCHLMPAGVLSV